MFQLPLVEYRNWLSTLGPCSFKMLQDTHAKHILIIGNVYIYQWSDVIRLYIYISLSQNRAPPHGIIIPFSNSIAINWESRRFKDTPILRARLSRDIPFAGRHLRDDHEKCVCTSWIPGIRDVLVKAFFDDTDMADPKSSKGSFWITRLVNSMCQSRHESSTQQVPSQVVVGIPNSPKPPIQTTHSSF